MAERLAVRPEEFQIKRAERRQARLRFAVCGASNAGKTWSSLEVAFGIVEELIARGLLQAPLDGKVGLIDSERKSAQLYAHLGPFDTIELEPPYSVERYMGAITAFERAGAAVIIIDQISHAWAGEGGVLQILDRFDESKRWNAFGTDVNPVQDKFVDAMLKSPAHIIATMRSKTAWVMQERTNKAGHQVHAPKRVGMAPIQRPGIEYEFTTMVNLETDTHVATVLKNRCPVFDKWEPKKLTREHGRALAAWLLEGAPMPAEATPGTPAERAAATAQSGARQCKNAPTVPDLQRAFEVNLQALRAFSGLVPDEELLRLRAELIAAKDARKADLGGSVPAGCITPDEAIELEQMILVGKLKVDEYLTRFNVKRLALLPVTSLREAVEAIQDDSLEHLEEPVPMPPAISAKLNPPSKAARPPTGKGPFDDFADDLPWQPQP